jgi:hypothetical protein
MNSLTKCYRMVPTWLSGPTIPLVTLLMVLMASCGPVAPSPTVRPDENLVQTRVAGTLTALATVIQPTPVPSPTDTPIPPAPTDTVPPTTPTPTAVPPPTSTSTRVSTLTPVITDWRGEYYANRDLAGLPKVVRNDVAVYFDWGHEAPAGELPVDDFGARWTRYLDFEGATYLFSVRADDGVRLWVDDELIINAWYDSAAHTVARLHPMVRGTHRIEVEYYEHVGTALLQLWWEKVDSYPDWKGQYWPNRDLSGGPALVRNDDSIDFQWGPNAAALGLPADNFSVRWTRTAQFDAATYRFHALVDDGARLWVDDLPVIDAWYDHEPHEVTADYALVQGVHHLRVEYYEHTGKAQIRVWWEKVVSPSYPDWKGEYWSNRNLSGSPALVRNDKSIDFDWGAKAAAPGLPEDNFSIRWSRQEDFDTGIYRFSGQTDDGLRFYVDDELILDEWHESHWETLYTAELALAGRHNLAVEYYEHGGLARVRFWRTLVRPGPPRD